MDTFARNYASVLRDPCNAPLANSVFVDSGGLCVTRFKFSYFTTQNSYVVMYTPNALTATSKPVGGTGAAYCAYSMAMEQYYGYSASDDTNMVGGYKVTYGNDTTSATNNLIADNVDAPTALGILRPPGLGYLLKNAVEVRCVGASLKLSYRGAQRQGDYFCHVGHRQPGYPGTPVEIAAWCEHQEPIGEGMLECKFAPEPNDRFMQAITESISFGGSVLTTDGVKNMAYFEPSFQGKCTLMAGHKGAKEVGGGVIYTATAVYEWRPKPGLGVLASRTTCASKTDVSAVLRNLAARGRWQVTPSHWVSELQAPQF